MRAAGRCQLVIRRAATIGKDGRASTWVSTLPCCKCSARSHGRCEVVVELVCRRIAGRVWIEPTPAGTPAARMRDFCLCLAFAFAVGPRKTERQIGIV
jgi:hypothetical protein